MKFIGKILLFVLLSVGILALTAMPAAAQEKKPNIYTGTIPSAVRYKNWKMYYTMMGSTSMGGFAAPETYAWTQITNIKRDPFEQAVGNVQKAATSTGGAIAAPSTAYMYDWQLLPIGQLMWMKELATYRAFPPLQVPESFNLDEIEKQMQASGAKGPGH